MDPSISGPIVEECFWGRTWNNGDEPEATGWLGWKQMFKEKSVDEEFSRAGWKVALRRLKQGSKESKELLEAFEEISDHLEHCALGYRSTAEEQHDINGFGSEFPQSNLKKSWCATKEVLHGIVESHLCVSRKIRDQICIPLSSFMNTYEKRMHDANTHLTELEDNLKYWGREIGHSRLDYELKSSEADKEDITYEKRTFKGTLKSDLNSEESAIPLNEIRSCPDNEIHAIKTNGFCIELGPIKYSITEVHQLVARMQHPAGGILIMDLKGIIFGTHHYVFSGRDAGDWFIQNIEEIKDDQQAVLFGELCLQRGFISALQTSGSDFQLSKTTYYEWKLLFTENQDGFCSTISSSCHFGKARSLAAKSDARYKCAISFGERSRLAYEDGVCSFLKEFRSLELNRIALLRDFLKIFLECVSNAVVPLSKVYDDAIKSIESCCERKDFSWIISEYRTGWERPSTFIYRSRYHQAAKDQRFGIELNELTQIRGEGIPDVVEICTRIIEDERSIIYTVSADIKAVHELRAILNSKDLISIGDALPYSPQVVADLLKMYLRELPTSAIPHYQYDVFRVLYAPKMNVLETKDKINYIQELIFNLPSSYFFLVRHLFRHLVTFLNRIETEEERSRYTSALSYTWGPLILRPLSEVQSQSVKESHPFRLAKDLIVYYSEIFRE